MRRLTIGPCVSGSGTVRFKRLDEVIASFQIDGIIKGKQGSLRMDRRVEEEGRKEATTRKCYWERKDPH